MFFVMAIFLNQDKADSRVDAPEVLDFLQIGILFFLIYFGAYYLAAINFGYQKALAREFQVTTAATSGILLLVTLQWRRSVTREARRLFGGLAAYMLLYGTLATIVSWIQVVHETPTGTWYDLACRLRCFVAHSGRLHGDRARNRQLVYEGATTLWAKCW